MEDLFGCPEMIPDEINVVLDKYDPDNLSYSKLKNMLAECEQIGYTFEYCLDAVPYNLRKMPHWAIKK